MQERAPRALPISSQLCCVAVARQFRGTSRMALIFIPSNIFDTANNVINVFRLLLVCELMNEIVMLVVEYFDSAMQPRI